MGALTRAIEKRYSVLSGASLDNPANWALRLFGANQKTSAGMDVNEVSAMYAIDVFTCIRIISETLAQIPLITYRRAPKNGGKDRATNHPLYRVLHDQANEEMTAFVLKETLQAHLLSWGNAYAWIERNQFGDCVGLWPLLPDRTWPYRGPNGELLYHTQVKKLPIPGDPGVWRIFPAQDIFHIPGLGFDGLVGYSVIRMIREQVGLAQAQEDYAGRFYSNGAQPVSVLTYAKSLSPDDVKRIEAQWGDKFRGSNNAWKTALLDQGMDIKTLGISQQDAQFIEQRKFSAEKIAGFYRVPPHMVGDTTKATSYGQGIEQQQIGFTQLTIQPWAVRWEHAINMKLLIRPRDVGYFSEFLIDSLQRADIEKRYNAYNLGWGKWLTTDDVRGKENMNPYVEPQDDAIGQRLIWSLNMTTAERLVAGETIKKLPAPGEAPAGDPGETGPVGDPGKGEPSPDAQQQAAISRRALARSVRIAFADTADRILRRESTDILALAKKRGAADRLEAFYDDHRDFVTRQFGPQIRSYAALISAEVSRELGRSVAVPDAFVAKYIDGYAQRHTTASRQETIGLVGDAKALGEALLTWSPRSEWIATREVNQAGNAFARAAYREAGVPFVVWMSGDECADCVGLHEKRVVPDAPFARRGQLSDDKYVPAAGLGHPPLCDGCDCVLVAAVVT